MHFALIIVPNFAPGPRKHSLDRQQEPHLLRLEDAPLRIDYGYALAIENEARLQLIRCEVVVKLGRGSVLPPRMRATDSTMKNPKKDRRLAQNREGPTGQGRVKNPSKDKRLLSNRDGPTGQGKVTDRARDKRLRANRSA